MNVEIPHADKRAMVLLVRDGRVLLARKKYGFGKGYLSAPGGKLEPDETTEQAMVREAHEEIGVTPTQYKLVAELDYTQTPDVAEPWRLYCYFYVCTEWRGSPQESDEMAPEWHDIDALPLDHMWEDNRHWLAHVLAGQAMRGVCVYNAQNQMVSHDMQRVNIS